MNRLVTGYLQGNLSWKDVIVVLAPGRSSPMPYRSPLMRRSDRWKRPTRTSDHDS